MTYISPFAQDFPNLPTIKGVKLSSAHTSMKYKNRDDVMLIELPIGTTAAGVFTKNSLCGEPVKWCREQLKNGVARAVIVNAGIANVFTGEKGWESVTKTANAVAELLDCKKEEVFIGSTGVIGEPIDDEKLLATLPELKEELEENGWARAARAFMTVDTFAKGVTRTAYIGDAEITINGIIKGSGMINPNMATMIGYVVMDAKIPAPILQKWLNADNEISYSCMTTEGDTSTSDTIMTFATGGKEHWEVKTGNEEFLTDLKQKLREIHIELAKMCAKDGEGVSKFLTINVTGAESFEAARNIGLSIANSPLVKTAVAGEDPNWGRIIMAIGKIDEKVVEKDVIIHIGDVLVTENSAISPTYNEADATAHMKGKEINFSVKVGSGEGTAAIYSGDLTHEFININADYRT